MLPVRSTFFLLLCLYLGLVQAEWTGVSIDIADFDSDWKFDNGIREAQITSLSFHLEEKFKTGLIAGGGIGYFDMRVESDSNVGTQKFDGQYLELLLRRAFPLSENITFNGQLNYRYYSGNSSGDTDRADIDWSETKLRFGVGVRYEHLRITPFVAFYHIDGDISDDYGTGSFENDDTASQGISFDFYVDAASYIRVEARAGYQKGGYLSFARHY